MSDDDIEAIGQSLAGQTALLRDLDAATKLFGRSITEAFAKGATEGRRFEDVLRGIGLKLSRGWLQQALRPIESGIAGALGQAFGSLGGGGAQVQAFASGGIVGQPTYFGLGRGLGLMGEAGAEAILPLARGQDGQLGVRSAAAAPAPLTVTVNIAAQDVDSFRRSEGQVSAAIARAVARGRRVL